MRPSIKRIGTRILIANLFMIPALIVLMSLTTANVEAASLSGTWTSNVAGKGYVQTSNAIDTNSDVKLVLSQSGNTVSGTITTTCSYSYAHSTSLGTQKPAIGSKETNTVTGTLSGSTLTLIRYTPASSGTSGGVPWTSPAFTITWTLYQSGNTLTGSGTYVVAGITYHYTFDLVSGDGAMGLNLGNGSVAVPSMIAIVGGGMCLAASFVPLPKGKVPGGSSYNGIAYSYQPSEVGITGGDSGAPNDPTYQGGAGLQYPQDYVNGVPVRPRYWQSQQHGPVCPFHGTMCNANYLNSEDPGAWFCPRCAEQGRGSGFPWGRK
ncbi:MAG TPA: hypothetical protein VGK23_09360 [Methanomassiliicoccales archaeon]|jgi:hypothetical protein